MADHSLTPPPFSRRAADVDTYRAVWEGFDGEVAVADPYRWLEDGSSSEVAEWVATHYQRTRQALDARPTRSRWIERLSALAALPTTMAVQVAGGLVFTLERPQGADQYVLCVRSGAGTRTLVDPAAMAHDAAVAIDWFHPSADGAFVAYGLSEGGTENSTLHVMHVATGEVLADRIANCRAASVAFLPDNSGFFYAVYPEGDDYHRHIRFHQIGSVPADDPVVFDRLPTEQSWPDVSLSADGEWLLVHVMVGWSHVDVYLLHRASGEWRVVVEGVEANTSLRVHGDRLVGVTFRDAPNGRAVWASLAQPSQWHTLVPERPDTVLGAFTIDSVAGEMLVVASSVAVDRLERWPLAAEALSPNSVSPSSMSPRSVVSLGVASVVSLDSDDGLTVLATSEFTAPVTVSQLHPDGTRTPIDSADTSALADVVVRQVFYPSTDCTLVPMFVAHRRDITPSAATPLILTGYGGFAISESPIWMPNLAAWCAAGGVFAVAGMRGGYEYGERWHEAGRRGNKQQVFNDFFAAADWLVAEGFTSRERLSVYGGSNGGLLMGAVITQRPDLAPAVWCAVPLLDMIRFPQFLIARLWTDEYGDPDVPEEFGWLWHYSPYHRVVDGAAYPAVVFTTAEGDTRVDPCHARKMAARLVAASASQAEHPIFLLQSGRAGHGAGKPTAMRVAEWADMLSFFCWQSGLENAGGSGVFQP